MRRDTRAPSPALVVAVMALIAALAGTAIAADPFTSKSAVVASKSAVGVKKVRMVARKVARRVSNKQITRRATNLSVARAGRLTRVTVQVESNTVAPNSNGAVSAVCPAGQQALAGGHGTPNGSVAQESRPAQGTSDPQLADNQTFNAWRVGVLNNNPSQITIRSWVACAG